MLFDGDNGLGHVASVVAMRAAIDKATSTGIAAAAVRNAGHFGAAACFTMMAVEEKMIGFATTNTGGASVVAPGGAERVVGNNPLSYALPAGEELPIVLDMACGASAWGKILTMNMYGQPVPKGVVLGRGRGECHGSERRAFDDAGGGAEGVRVGAGYGHPGGAAGGRFNVMSRLGGAFEAFLYRD